MKNWEPQHDPIGTGSVISGYPYIYPAVNLIRLNVIEDFSISLDQE